LRHLLPECLEVCEINTAPFTGLADMELDFQIPAVQKENNFPCYVKLKMAFSAGFRALFENIKMPKLQALESATL
jgi:hypothetical protein